MVMSRAVEVCITQQWLASQAHSGTKPGKWEVAKPSLVVRYCDQKGRSYYAHKLVYNCPRKLPLGGQHIQASKRTWVCSSGHDLHLTSELLIQLRYNEGSWGQHRPKHKGLQPTWNKLPWFLSNSQISSPSLDWEGESTSLPHPLKPPSRPYPGISKCPAL